MTDKEWGGTQFHDQATGSCPENSSCSSNNQCSTSCWDFGNTPKAAHPFAEPQLRPHPFAATTYWISDAIKNLRAIAAHLADAHSPVTYWRGMKDLGLTIELVGQGGTEFACTSMTASKKVAVNSKRKKQRRGSKRSAVAAPPPATPTPLAAAPGGYDSADDFESPAW